MIFRKSLLFNSENQMKPIKTLCEQNAEIKTQKQLPQTYKQLKLVITGNSFISELASLQ
jgi:hypothetical protein